MVRLQHNARTNNLVEAGVFGRQRVLAGGELRDRVLSPFVDDDAAVFVGADVGYGNHRTGYDRSGIIRYAPHNRGAEALRSENCNN